MNKLSEGCWSRIAEAGLECGTQSRPHQTQGLCSACNQRRLRAEFDPHPMGEFLKALGQDFPGMGRDLLRPEVRAKLKQRVQAQRGKTEK